MKYPGGEHHGKLTTHTTFDEHTGKPTGTHVGPGHFSDATSHPGFAAVQSKIAAKEGISKDRAGAILAASSRHASKSAKKANPRLKRVKG